MDLPRSVLSAIKREGVVLAIGAGLAGVGTLISLIPSYIVYQMVAIILNDGVDILRDQALVLVAAAAIAVLLKVLLQSIGAYVSHAGAYRVLYDLRLMLGRHLARLPLGALGDRTTGSIKKILQEDVEQIELALSHAIPDTFSALLAPLAAIAVMMVVDWRLGLALLAPLPLTVFFYWRTLEASKNEREAFVASHAKLNGVAVQYVRGMKVIKAFTRGDSSFRELTSAIDEMAAIVRRYAVVALRPFTIMLVVMRGTLLTVLPVGVLLLLNGMASPEALVLALLLGIGIVPPIVKLTYSAGQAFWKIAMAGAEIEKLMDLAPLAEPAQAAEAAGNDITFEDVGLMIGEERILNGVDFHVPAGTVAALVGPSGAGKSTIAKLVPRFFDASSGRVLIGGVLVDSLPAEELMRRVAFVFQDTFLFDRSIAENIRVGRPEATDAQVWEVAERACVTDFLDDLPNGIDTRVGDDGAILSGGQRQRIAIARAMLKDAPIIILDEATAALDPESEARVHLALGELARGKTVLVIAHRLATIRNADRILVVEGGRIEAAGRHDELFERSPTYRSQWRAYELGHAWQFAPDARRTAAPAAQAAVAAVPPVAEQPDRPYENLTGGSFVAMLMRLLGPYRGTFLKVAMPLQLIDGMFYSLPMLLTLVSILDLVHGRLDASRAAIYLAALVVGFLIQLGLQYGALNALWKVHPGAVASLQKAIGYRFRRLPLSYFQRTDAGRLNALITTHPAQLDFLTMPNQFLRAIVGPLIAAFVLAFVDWRLTLVLFATIPLYFLALGWADRLFKKGWKDLFAARAEANRSMLEFLRGLPVIRAFGGYDEAGRQFEHAMRLYRDASLHAVSKALPSVGIAGAILEAGFVLVVAIGIWLATTGAVQPEMLIAFAILALAFYMPILDATELTSYRRQLQSSMEQVSEVFEVPLLPEPVAGKPIEAFDIRLRDVTFSYDKRKVLDGVSVELPAGKLTALVGPSGSGKSTLVHLIARFWDVDRGGIEIGGVDLRQTSLDTLYGSLAMVFQDVFLFDDTVAGNLRLGRPDASQEAIEAAARAARIHERIMQLPDGYDTMVGEGGARLSGGERQRLAIARAILKDAPIVLLDEATAAIDPENELAIREALGALTVGRTVVVIAHRLGSIATADRIVVLDRQGRLAGVGTHDTLLTTCPLYRELWASSGVAERWGDSGNRTPVMDSTA